MTLTEMRNELMDQHARLRELAATARAAASRARAGETGWREALHESVAQLHDEFEKHNAREEELLGAVIKTIDAWGEARAQLMDEHHHHEHDHLGSALLEASQATDGVAAAQKVDHVVNELFQHMNKEEHEILSPNVLRDDIYSVDYGGG